MDTTLKQVGVLLLDAVPTVVLLLLLYAIYQNLVRKPLLRILQERRDRTEGAVQKARADVAAAESRTQEYEQKLREALREIRSAIDEFKRDTYGACAQGASTSSNQTLGNQGAAADPRSRVYIDDCKIFEVDNLDRYPPTLQMLVDGIRVKSRAPNLTSGGAFDDNHQATNVNH